MTSHCTGYRSGLLGAAAVCALAISPTAIADDVADDAISVQDEIVVVGHYLYADQVNALKAPTPIIDVPQSLSILTADQLLERGFDSVSDILNYVPGVNASQGEGHRDSIVFRGVRSTADFFVDGVRDDVQYYRPLYNLEQVEILRGPNALLFGRGGTGGVLNRVTKKAQLGERFSSYQLGVDTFGAYNGQFDTNFDVSAGVSLRLNAYYEHLDNHRDFFDGDHVGFNPTARFELSPFTLLDISYEYANHERFIDRGIATGADGRPVEAFKDIVFGDPAVNTSEFEAHILRANLQHEFSEALKGNLTIAHGDYDKLYDNFYASGYDQVTTPDRVTLDGYIDTTQRQRLTLAGNLVGEFATGGINHTLIAGAEFLDTSNDNDRFNARWSTSGFTDDNETFAIMRPLALSDGVGVNADGLATVNDYSVAGALNDRTQSTVEVFSVFVQDQIELGPHFDIVLGARFDRFDQSTTNLIDPANPTVADRTDEEVSPRVGLIYKPQENVSLYASYSEAFLPRSGEQFASTGSLDPDQFEQAEIGLKWDVTQGLSLTAAYFQNDQTRADRDNTTGEGFEIRGLEVEGFEVQVQGQLTDRFFLSAGYSYLDGETGDGAQIPRELPENMFSVWGDYQVTDRFGVGLGATYQDESFITDFTIGSTGPHPTLPSYTRFDAAAYYEVSDDLRLQLNIENLTDETYFPSAHSTHQATVGAPLNAKISLRGKF